MKVTSFAELYALEKERIIQDCTLCGICVDVCPTIPLAGLNSMRSEDVQTKVIDVLKDGIMSDEAIKKADSCTNCFACKDVCPVDINPLIVQQLLQLELVKLGLKRHPGLEMKLGDSIYFFPDILASMQIKPEDRRWSSRVSDSPQPRDIVVFTGCNLVRMPDKILILHDILERLDLNFTIVSGGELCCGMLYSSINLEKAEARGKALLHTLSTFNPKQVLFCCGGCTYQVSQFLQKFVSIPFQYDNLYHFLSQRIDELKRTHSINKTVTLHDPCVSAREFGDTTSLRKLLHAIPGLKLVEMNKNKEQTVCCGSVSSRYFPKVSQALTGQCLENAADTGAEVLVDYCAGCHLQFSPEESNYPFEIQYYLTIIGEAMGIVHKDKLKKFYRYADAGRILAEYKENIEASPYDFNTVARLTKLLFEKPSP